MTIETPGAISVLLDEHAAIGTVLDYLDRAVAAVSQGRTIEPEFFHDLLRFFRLFVGQCHHGKEEQILFPLLRHASTATNATIARLEEEHAEGVELADAFATAVAGYAAHGLDAADPLAAAARDYASFLRRHIAFENEDLLERVDRAMPPAGLESALAAFDRFEEEVMGPGTHAQLHRMIDTLGPRLAAQAD